MITSNKIKQMRKEIKNLKGFKKMVIDAAEQLDSDLLLAVITPYSKKLSGLEKEGYI